MTASEEVAKLHVIDRLKDRSIETLVAGLATLLASDPRRHLSQIAGIAEVLAAGEGDKKRAAQVRRFFKGARDADPPHVSTQLMRRAIEATSPRCRTRLVTNLVLWAHSGRARRTEAQKTVGTSPLVLLISPTMRCNLRCAGCYAGEYERKNDLPMAVVERVVAEARELGTHVVTLLGGEPFVREDVFHLFERFPDMTFQVFTNGTLITDDMARRLERVGNVLVCFSLDGLESEHDARRGDGIFRRVVQGMTALRGVGVPFGSSTMITSKNYMSVTSDAFTDYLIEQGCLWGWHFLYMPVGKNPDISLMPTPEQREHLRTNGAAFIRTNKPLFVMDFWNDAPYVGGCIAAGREYLHINSNGDVEPCIFTHFSTDNIKDKSLAEALQSDFFAMIRDRQPYSPNLLRPCMLIDSPGVVRKVVQESGAEPTHPGADELLSSLGGALNAYAVEYKQIADCAWRDVGGRFAGPC